MRSSEPPKSQRTIPVTCRTHGAETFCNLRMSKTGDKITLDPHVTGACVVELDQPAATTVRDTLTEWLGD